MADIEIVGDKKKPTLVDEIRNKHRGRKKIPPFVSELNMLSKGERPSVDVPLEYYHICEHYGIPHRVPEKITTQDAALLIGVCKVTLLRMIENGVLEAANVCSVPGKKRYKVYTLSVLKRIYDLNQPVKHLQVFGS
jgi:hypothetical protein